jgi:hypothetical protein
MRDKENPAVANRREILVGGMSAKASAGAAKIPTRLRDSPRRYAHGFRLVGEIHHAHGLPEFLAIVRHGFPDDRHEILHFTFLLPGKFGEAHLQQREGRVCAHVLREIEPRNYWIPQIFVGWSLGAVQQLLAVHNFDRARPAAGPANRNCA